MQSVAETNEFQKRVKALRITETEVSDIISSLAKNPELGTSLGAGLYKARIARKDHGKSGGYRVLYFYKPIDMPIFLLTIFPKSEKDNITKGEKKILIGLCDTLTRAYKTQK